MAARPLFAQPFDEPGLYTTTLAGPSAAPWIALWLAGSIIVLAIWTLRWLHIRRALESAAPLSWPSPLPVLSVSGPVEPGVFGVFRQRLILPNGIASILSPPQLDAVLAHEFCHARRRDNLAAVLHLFVQAAFWFHPLVWWIGARLIEEREQACDEEVIRLGNDPHLYAEAILRVCRHYAIAPAPCPSLSLITGASLKQRVASIVAARALEPIGFTRKLLLATAGLVILALPLTIGIANAQRESLTFEVASIRPSDPAQRGMRLGHTAGGGLSTTGVTVKILIEIAYGIRDFQIVGAPAWIANERFDIIAKPDRADPELPEGAPRPVDYERAQGERFATRIRALLADRFALIVRRESAERPVYLLTAVKGGHKLRPAEAGNGISRNRGTITGSAAPLELFVNLLSSITGRPVLNQTGLTGKFDFKLEWTEEMSGIADRDGAPAAADAGGGPSLFSAMQEQLGLQLKAGKGNVPVVVVERVEKPSAN